MHLRVTFSMRLPILYLQFQAQCIQKVQLYLLQIVCLDFVSLIVGAKTEDNLKCWPWKIFGHLLNV